ncbi:MULTISPECIES: DUF6438 domain-containing protein [unclassified Sphingomonas]|uniref:DUF6438 domain-containing protein n=1 Tax=unclassified Sphingomonas TaxID=196159 RepID=UPI0006FDF8D6|nr:MULTISPECIES: DUF6438 domain-containing protein [unclassified Sphingomonas]KQN00362.1 hypothetical protein ASE78_04385 [Sphingomonas sp. Leaf25]KQN36530.1 hypothetical protein ASE97_12345 [Sphingomonas sp. Leaf42]KQT27151.1 hypothetical protein ASG37_13090 [Sphingomonas sp. Leaf407]
MKIIALGLVPLLGGCVMAIGNTEGGKPVAIERETISYETSPCFGTCPVYMVTIQPDGRGTFEGKRFTAVSGVRSFQATPAQYRAFAAKLQPYRPAQGDRLLQPGQPGCGNAPTDMPSVEVRWSELSGASQKLSYYYGCGAADGGRTGEALRGAIGELPVASYIKAG